MTLTEAGRHVGADVVYRPHPGAPAEDGEITGVSESYVFVLYVGDRRPKATRAEDLRFPASSVPATESRHTEQKGAGRGWLRCDPGGCSEPCSECQP